MTTWPTVKLGEVLRHRKEFITIDDLAVYKRPRVRLHVQGIVVRDDIPGALIKTKMQQVCRTGEFLVAEIDAKVGGFGIVPEVLNGAIVSGHYFLFVIDESKLSEPFLDFFIRTPAFREQVAAQGSTNYAAIRPADVLGYEIPLPPLPEQRRIVAQIKELATQIDEARSLRRAAAGEREAFWPSILQATLLGSGQAPIANGRSDTAADLLAAAAKRNAALQPSNNNNAHPQRPSLIQQGPADLPDGWVWTTLGSVLSHLVDCVNDTPDFAETNTGFLGLKSTNIRPYKFDLAQRWYVSPADFARWNRREAPKPGDIILTREAPMGNACMLPSGPNVCLTQRLMLLRADDQTIAPDLLLHFLNSPIFQDQVKEHCRGCNPPRGTVLP